MDRTQTPFRLERGILPRGYATAGFTDHRVLWPVYLTHLFGCVDGVVVFRVYRVVRHSAIRIRCL